jgi:hypothetical protein
MGKGRRTKAFDEPWNFSGIIKDNGEIMQFNRKGIGTTIIAWGEDVSEDSFRREQTCEYQLRTGCSSC